jgi:hypothetical protein
MRRLELLPCKLTSPVAQPSMPEAASQPIGGLVPTDTMPFPEARGGHEAARCGGVATPRACPGAVGAAARWQKRKSIGRFTTMELPLSRPHYLVNLALHLALASSIADLPRPETKRSRFAD